MTRPLGMHFAQVSESSTTIMIDGDYNPETQMFESITPNSPSPTTYNTSTGYKLTCKIRCFSDIEQDPDHKMDT